METPDISLHLIARIVVIFGWFWLVSWTIVRIWFFKKRVFSLLIFVYFSQGVAKISELIAFNMDMNKTLWIYELTNMMMIVGFFCLSNRLINMKSKYKKDEKFNSDTA